MTIPEIKNVCFVGAGTMGSYNALVASLAGYRATVFDLSQSALDQVWDAQLQFGAFLIGAGFCSEEDLSDAMDRIVLETNLTAATADADLVSESIFERLDIKRELHQQLDELCPTHTIITTNTSALRVSDIEDVVDRGALFAALHSHLGAPLVDIVGGPRTSPETLDTLNRYTKSIGGVPLLLKKEHPGYVLNAMLGPLLSTAMLIVSHERASTEDVDRAWMHFRNAPMGPFGMIDLFGIQLIHDSWNYRDVDSAYVDNRQRILHLLQPYVDQDHLGMKSGSGFYKYPQPAYQDETFLGAAKSQQALHSLLAATVVANGLYLANLDVAEPAQIDMAWKAGTYLNAGPFEILKAQGIEGFRTELEQLHSSGLIDATRYRSVNEYLSKTRGDQPI